MNVPLDDPAGREAWLRDRLATGGTVLGPDRLQPAGEGFDNGVLFGRDRDGLAVVIKYRRRARRARYASAAWASSRLAHAGLPVPRILWHDDDICVETYLPGQPLAPDHLDAATSAGAMLRAAHTIPVRGFGRLNPIGQGPRTTLQAW
jgi:hypothetical protein